MFVSEEPDESYFSAATNGYGWCVPSWLKATSGGHTIKLRLFKDDGAGRPREKDVLVDVDARLGVRIGEVLGRLGLYASAFDFTTSRGNAVKFTYYAHVYDVITIRPKRNVKPKKFNPSHGKRSRVPWLEVTSKGHKATLYLVDENDAMVVRTPRIDILINLEGRTNLTTKDFLSEIGLDHHDFKVLEDEQRAPLDLQQFVTSCERIILVQ